MYLFLSLELGCSYEPGIKVVLQSDLLAVLKHKHCGCQDSTVVKRHEFGGWVIVNTHLSESITQESLVMQQLYMVILTALWYKLDPDQFLLCHSGSCHVYQRPFGCLLAFNCIQSSLY